MQRKKPSYFQSSISITQSDEGKLVKYTLFFWPNKIEPNDAFNLLEKIIDAHCMGHAWKVNELFNSNFNAGKIDKINFDFDAKME